MATPTRYLVLLGGAVVAQAWSIHAANEKLTAAVLLRAQSRGSFPVTGEIFDGEVLVKQRHFPFFFSSEVPLPENPMAISDAISEGLRSPPSLLQTNTLVND